MSNPDPVCRLAWRPSRWEAFGVVLLGASGAGGVLASEIAHPWAEAIALAAVVLAIVQARRGQRRRLRRLVVGRVATLDGYRLDTCDVAWRGPLAFLRARESSGRVHRLAWWPDTLTRRRRRALRLAVESLAYDGTPR